MLYRKMPRIQEELSILGFGCMRLPVTDDGAIDEPQAERMMHMAVDHGVNYIDTARPYHGGKSEAFVGRASKNIRDKVLLATKLPSWAITTRADMDAQLDDQLKVMDTDRIDVYLLHSLTAERWDNLLNCGVFDFLESAKKKGKIRYIGFSFHDGFSTFKKIADAYKWDVCQIQYNFVDKNFQAGLAGLEHAQKQGIGVIVMEPIKGGCITMVKPGDLGNLAEKAGYTDPTLADLALRWVWNHDGVQVALSGMSNIEQLEQNLKSADKGKANALTVGEFALADAAKKILANRMRVPCTACAYCMPCPSGVVIPQCFSTYNTAAISENWGAQKTFYHHFFDNWTVTGKKASACVECGACVPKCPQHIDIPKKLKEVVTAFESDGRRPQEVRE